MPDITGDVIPSGERFTAAVETLSDAQVREPSTLPGWNRGQVITHVARSIDAYLWLLAFARTGVEPGQRTDAAALSRAVQAGAERPARDLAADVRGRLSRLADEAAAMPAGRWRQKRSRRAVRPVRKGRWMPKPSTPWNVCSPSEPASV
ncbi:maleylpyruvate isomerase N-terminal domain-containing protein [Streptomyces silvisoli]|uniref:Maleylpyruvate isomerase N-terminal domain-containing protein n=1 Tax=Streptomyces silvisoli TaxID=3034235 RepID=A0ABT5ZDX8_9ACTN|nr:maleylpyruvate isomerase N-terminal domain-containing protein [Streptomyces silvisoli]MDF3288037.1 maleylpyruvate isomerase N-terminal domain-containing protein [Streptomyces silvisoli]